MYNTFLSNTKTKQNKNIWVSKKTKTYDKTWQGNKRNSFWQMVFLVLVFPKLSFSFSLFYAAKRSSCTAVSKAYQQASSTVHPLSLSSWNHAFWNSTLILRICVIHACMDPMWRYMHEIIHDTNIIWWFNIPRIKEKNVTLLVLVQT